MNASCLRSLAQEIVTQAFEGHDPQTNEWVSQDMAAITPEDRRWVNAFIEGAGFGMQIILSSSRPREDNPIVPQGFRDQTTETRTQVASQTLLFTLAALVVAALILTRM